MSYKPLSGELEVFRIAKKIKEKIMENFEFYDVDFFKGWIRFFSTEYPRFLDRIHMARLIANYSNKFIVVSDGWERLDEFKDFYREKIDDKDELYELLKRSKINLYTNTYGGGMHNKIFEIMINGGFVALPYQAEIICLVELKNALLMENIFLLLILTNLMNLLIIG